MTSDLAVSIPMTSDLAVSERRGSVLKKVSMLFSSIGKLFVNIILIFGSKSNLFTIRNAHIRVNQQNDEYMSIGQYLKVHPPFNDTG